MAQRAERAPLEHEVEGRTQTHCMPIGFRGSGAPPFSMGPRTQMNPLSSYAPFDRIWDQAPWVQDMETSPQ